ncbi:hypothetical protein FA13DRAFT_1263924 [Coprinellus micaceus]|uniref:Uncharacterized protein n=1 Tax=Coprinellus micaceus TaxID=71717 RepID=A0A4Y7R943_COPMI|nr:hypothetical protein FA13DRAFT_1263924 [Coprinellus micaceus]
MQKEKRGGVQPPPSDAHAHGRFADLLFHNHNARTLPPSTTLFIAPTPVHRTRAVVANLDGDVRQLERPSLNDCGRRDSDSISPYCGSAASPTKTLTKTRGSPNNPLASSLAGNLPPLPPFKDRTAPISPQVPPARLRGMHSPPALASTLPTRTLHSRSNSPNIRSQTL